MPQQVPAVERALEILELLEARHDRPLGLSDIARALSMNKASCYATLTLLAQRGYLVRRGDKSYSLGPAILPLAQRVLEEQEPLQHARAEMADISRELGLDCIASSVIADEMVILARTASPESFGVSVRVGSRFPLVPPLGTVFLAWATPERVRRWLEGLPGGIEGPARERYLDALAVIRDRGYSVALGGRPQEARDPTLADDHLLFDVRPDDHLPVAHIAAPIFAPEGATPLALTVVGLPERLTSDDVPRVAGRLLAATAAVARATWGRERTADASPAPASGPRRRQAPGRQEPVSAGGRGRA